MSTAYVEKVVKPPRTPVPKKGRTRRWAAHVSVMTTMNTPITAQPTTLVQKVAQGKPPAWVGHAREAAYRAEAPIAPPIATTATTGACPCRREGRARAAMV